MEVLEETSIQVLVGLKVSHLEVILISRSLELRTFSKNSLEAGTRLLGL